MSNDVHDVERLKELQALPLERKVGFTAARIAEWYHHWNGQVHVSFSGGKDSTVLLYIARKLFPDIKAVFIDTGLEYPEIRAFVKTWDNVDWIRPKLSFLQVIQKYGYPVISKEISQFVYYARSGQKSAMQKLCLVPVDKCKIGNRYLFPQWGFLVKDAPFPISHRCCDILKKGPAHEYSDKTKTKPIVATMTEESMLRKNQWIRNGCNAFDAKRPISKPMSFWLEDDVLRYIQTMNIPIASCYGKICNTLNGGGLQQPDARGRGACSVVSAFIWKKSRIDFSECISRIQSSGSIAWKISA